MSNKVDKMEKLAATFRLLDVNARMRVAAMNVRFEGPADGAITDHGA